MNRENIYNRVNVNERISNIDRFSNTNIVIALINLCNFPQLRIYLVQLFTLLYNTISLALKVISHIVSYLFYYIMKLSGRRRIIYDREDGVSRYLIRYYLFLKDRDTFPFNVFIHKFLKSDPDHLHDHPWGFSTLILWGGYWEYTENDVKWYGPLSFRTVEATHKHRIELNEHSTCWTLFIPYRKEREWGFYVNDEWIHHEKYYNKKYYLNNNVPSTEGVLIDEDTNKQNSGQENENTADNTNTVDNNDSYVTSIGNYIINRVNIFQNDNKTD